MNRKQTLILSLRGEPKAQEATHTCGQSPYATLYAPLTTWVIQGNVEMHHVPFFCVCGGSLSELQDPPDAGTIVKNKERPALGDKS